MSLEFTEEQLNLKCKIHGKEIEITFDSDGNSSYIFCCHSLRSNFFSILEPNQKNELDKPDTSQ